MSLAGNYPSTIPLFLVATMLAGLAIVVRRARRSDRANRSFALYAVIVAANYLLVGIAGLLRPTDGWEVWLLYAAFGLQVFEIPALLAFVGVYPRPGRLDRPWARRVALFAAAGVLAMLAADPSLVQSSGRPTRILFEAYILGGYCLAVGSFLVKEAKRPAGAPTLFPPAFLVGWCVLLFTRIGLAAALAVGVDLRVAATGIDPQAAALVHVLVELLIAWGALGLAALALAPLATREAWPGIRRALTFAALAAGGVWALSQTVRVASLTLGVSAREGDVLLIVHQALSNRFALRWVLFAAVVGPALLRNQVFEIEPRLRRALLTTVVGGIFLLAFVAGLAALQRVVRLDGTLFVRSVLVFAAIGIAGSQSVRLGRWIAERAFPPERERDEAYRRMRRLEIYRDAHAAAAEGRSTSDDLETLRVSLGLTQEEARAAATLARTRLEPASGVVFARRYRLVAPLGRGGTGRVWRADDLRDSAAVAIKILDDHGRAAEVEREAAVARNLQHPRVLPVLDHGHADGVVYVVTPWIRGGTLADRLAGGALAPDAARALVRDVLAGLAAAHAAGLVHRDVKPSNVFLDQDGRALVGDFGVAVGTDPSRTATSILDPRVAGTLAYLPPEALDGDEPSPAWDVYAVGTLLFEMLVGRVPRAGERPPADVPGDLAEAISRARDEDPATRPVDASMLATLLR